MLRLNPWRLVVGCGDSLGRRSLSLRYLHGQIAEDGQHLQVFIF